MDKTLHSRQHEKLIELLILARKNAGLTQIEYAQRLNEYQSFVARLESGQRRVDVIELLRFQEILGFDLSALLDEIRTL